MSGAHGWISRQVVGAALRVPACVNRLGHSVWLYLALVSAAGHRGLVVRHIKKLADQLSVSEKQVEEWLARLSEAGLVEVESPAPFLVIKLRFWSSSMPSESANPRESGTQPGASPLSVPVSGSSAAAAASSKQEDGGQGEGEPLLREVLEKLDDDADPIEMRQLVERHPPDVIRRALRRVEGTPQIRKSKTALFRYLLPRV